MPAAERLKGGGFAPNNILYGEKPVVAYLAVL